MILSMLIMFILCFQHSMTFEEILKLLEILLVAIQKIPP